MSRILVTGGAGFIGSHIVDELIRQGHQVWVVDDLSSGKKENVNTKANFVKLNITNPELTDLFRKVKPEYVFHLAAQKNVRKSVENPKFDAEINILGSLNIFENSKKFKIKKIIFSSTGGAIYGDTEVIPTPETHQEKPVSPYGVAKLAIDKYLYYYYFTYKLPYISLRLANVYGPRQDPEGEAGVVAIFLDRILTNQQPMINGDGTQTRDYVYVSDVVNANIKSLDDKILGIFNIGTSKETDVNTLYDMVKAASGSQFDRRHCEALAGEQMRSCLSYEKFRTATGWSPEVDIEEGIQKTFEWFKKEYEKSKKS